MTGQHQLWTRKAFYSSGSGTNKLSFRYRFDDTSRGHAARDYFLRVQTASWPAKKVTVAHNSIILRNGVRITNVRPQEQKRDEHGVLVVDADGDPVMVSVGEYVNANLTHPNAGATVDPEVWLEFITRRDVDHDDTGPNREPSSISIQGPFVQEGPGVTAAVRVFLDLPAKEAFTVDYATEDFKACSGEEPYGGRCTATSGKDYTKASGTVRFAKGDTEKTISIAIEDDAIDEGPEPFFVRLSNVAEDLPNVEPGEIAVIASDGLGIVTIRNSDPIPLDWIARLGREVGGHAVDSLWSRLDSESETTEQRSAAQTQTGATEWNAGLDHDMTGFETPSGNLNVLEHLHLRFGEKTMHNGGITVWTNVAHSRFTADSERFAVSRGEVTTGFVGVDTQLRDDLLAGAMLSHSRATGELMHTTSEASGTARSTLVALHPYAAYEYAPESRLWGMFGIGHGTLHLEFDAGEQLQIYNTDLSYRMGALGLKAHLFETGGFKWSSKNDALWTRTTSKGGDGVKKDIKGDFWRVRTRIAIDRPINLERETWTPGVSIGLRHDGGDAENETAAELGARIGYSAGRLSSEIKTRKLVGADHDEWAISGTLQYQPPERRSGLHLGALSTTSRAACRSSCSTTICSRTRWAPNKASSASHWKRGTTSRCSNHSPS